MTGNTLADIYRQFAEREAQGTSDTYFMWSSGVARDQPVLGLIAALPGMKRQPNLIFAAARFLGAPIGPYDEFRKWLIAHWVHVVDVVTSRATQTNEAARCAVLLPVLSRLDGPLALIEAGAAAGLCLYPDRYSYRYDADGVITTIDPADGESAVTLPCSINTDDIPHQVPDVAWRAGVDLNPLDPTDPDSRAWLRTLIWPEHEARRSRLDAAMSIATRESAYMVRGDLIDATPDLVAAAPAGSHVVVFHSSVLVYLDAEARERFAQLMRSMPNVTWISNEGEHVLPRVERRLTRPSNGRTVLAVNEQPVALVGPHGQSYEAL